MPEANGRSGERLEATSARLRSAGRGSLGDLWWWFLVRGALAWTLGIAVLVRPDESLTTVTRLVGLYCLLHGTVNLLAALRGAPAVASWLAAGVGLTVGVVLAPWSGVPLRVFLLVFGGWAILIGASHLLFARSLGESSSTTTLGWLLVALGAVLVLWPGTDVAAVSRLIAYAALVLALPLLYIASRLRFLQRGAVPDA